MLRPRSLTTLVVASGIALAFAAACSDDASGDRAATPTSRPAETAPTTEPARTVAAEADCPAPAATAPEGVATLTSGGVDRRYRVSVPEDLDPKRPTPVIVDLHGSGSDMEQQFVYSQLAARGPERGYVVVTPEGTGSPRGWALSGEGDDAFVADLLGEVGEAVCVDERRVFATGISNGAAYSALVACRQPYRFAGVGLVAASVGPIGCPPRVRPTVVAFHGTDDAIVPYGGGAVASEGSNGLDAPGAEDAIAEWADHDGCDSRPGRERVGSDVEVIAWAGCAGGATVSLHRVEGGGHTWPGAIDVRTLGLTHLGATTQTVSATDVILDTFDAAPDRSW